GQGSRFWIDIAVAAADRERDSGPAEDAGLVDIGGGGTVLCIDDAAAGLELEARIIEGIPGARVLTSKTAEDGLVQARRHRPTLILMDINLPGMDGFEALAELRRHEETRAIPVFALSAAAASQDIERGLAAGFERYLIKPFKARDFQRAIAAKLRAAADGEILGVQELDHRLDIVGSDGMAGAFAGFAAQGQQQLADLDQAWRDGRHGDALAVTHRFRGGAATFQMTALQARLARLEAALRLPTIDEAGIAGLIGNLSEEWERSVAAFQRWLASRS
ncbi:MAG: response regulator, partial [Alphaproteobacteria bacterium]|nr:response regulator [Alphaproteobacteria bacterium]